MCEIERIVTGSALEPGAVLVGDQRTELPTVVVRRDGGQAAAADRRDARALRFDAAARLGVVGVLDERFVSRAPLPSERAPPRLGQQHLRRKAIADLAPQPEPLEPARREHDRIEAPLATLPQT